jgi:two-component system sensor histidine kinase QseC
VTSIRRTLERRLLAGLFVVFGAVGAILFAHIHELLLDELDASLETRARLLAADVGQGPDGAVEAPFLRPPLPELGGAKPDAYLELAFQDGREAARSPGLGDERLIRLKLKRHRDATFDDLRLRTGHRVRVVGLRFVPSLAGAAPGPGAAAAGGAAPAAGEARGPEPMLLIYARRRADLDRTLGLFALSLAGAGLLLLAGSAFVVRRTVRASMGPLAAVGAQAARIDARSLDARFPAAGMPEELAPICARLNELLERLQASFRRERRFSSDVAHELRTLIAELRSMAEVALGSPEGGPALAEQSRDVLAIAVQMGHIVSNLLALARSESGQDAAHFEPVDVPAVIAEAWRPFEAEAARRGLRVGFTTPAAPATSDRTMLASIFTNLFSNAVAYTPAGGDVACTLAVEPTRLAITVENANDTLSLEDLEHLCEPLWRKDAARSDRDHAGLGLALVAAYAARLGAEVTPALPRPDRFAITVSLPREPRVA